MFSNSQLLTVKMRNYLTITPTPFCRAELLAECLCFS